MEFESKEEYANILSYKYIICNPSDEYKQNGNEPVYSSKTMNVFLNDNYIPFGYTYKYKLSSEEYSNMGIMGDSLLDVCIVDIEDYEDVNLTEWEMDCKEDRLDLYASDYSGIDLLQDGKSIDFKVNSSGNFILIELPLEIKGNVSVGFCGDFTGRGMASISMLDEQQKILDNETFLATYETTNYELNFSLESRAKYILLEMGKSDGEVILSNAYIKYPTRKDDAKYKKRNYLDLVEFSNNNIKGNIKSSGNELIFLSVPYDDGWNLRINGEKRKIVCTNIGFIGAMLDEGNNYIELQYVTPGIIPGAIISFISLAILFVIIRKLRG